MQLLFSGINFPLLCDNLLTASVHFYYPFHLLCRSCIFLYIYF